MKNRCLHQRKGVCPSCRAFSRDLKTAVRDRSRVWTPGVMGRLSRGAGRGR